MSAKERPHISHYFTDRELGAELIRSAAIAAGIRELANTTDTENVYPLAEKPGVEVVIGAFFDGDRDSLREMVIRLLVPDMRNEQNAQNLVDKINELT